MFNKNTRSMSKFNYNDWMWSRYSIEELREILFNDGRLDSERRRASKEIQKRTTENTINRLMR